MFSNWPLVANFNQKHTRIQRVFLEIFSGVALNSRIFVEKAHNNNESMDNFTKNFQKSIFDQGFSFFVYIWLMFYMAEFPEFF